MYLKGKDSKQIKNTLIPTDSEDSQINELINKIEFRNIDLGEGMVTMETPLFRK